MSFDEIQWATARFLPLIVTVVVLSVAVRLLHERPGELLRDLVREFLSVFERRLTRRGINLIGGFIMLILTMLAFAEGLFATVAEVTDGTRSSPQLQFYSEALKYALIFFFGLYFLISIALSRGEP
jgi:hypothetical protein